MRRIGYLFISFVFYACGESKEPVYVEKSDYLQAFDGYGNGTIYKKVVLNWYDEYGKAGITKSLSTSTKCDSCYLFELGNVNEPFYLHELLCFIGTKKHSVQINETGDFKIIESKVTCDILELSKEMTQNLQVVDGDLLVVTAFHYEKRKWKISWKYGGGSKIADCLGKGSSY